MERDWNYNKKIFRVIFTIQHATSGYIFTYIFYNISKYGQNDMHVIYTYQNKLNLSDQTNVFWEKKKRFIVFKVSKLLHFHESIGY